MIFEETIKFLNEILYFLLYILLTKINRFYIYIFQNIIYIFNINITYTYTYYICILHKPNLRKLFKRICEYFYPLLYYTTRSVLDRILYIIVFKELILYRHTYVYPLYSLLLRIYFLNLYWNSFFIHEYIFVWESEKNMFIWFSIKKIFFIGIVVKK